MKLCSDAGEAGAASPALAIEASARRAACKHGQLANRAVLATCPSVPRHYWALLTPHSSAAAYIDVLAHAVAARDSARPYRTCSITPTTVLTIAQSTQNVM